jgi:hypothetical protein
MPLSKELGEGPAYHPEVKAHSHSGGKGKGMGRSAGKKGHWSGKKRSDQKPRPN